MSKERGSAFRRVLIIVLALLLAGAVAATVLWRWNIRRFETQSRAYAQTLRTLIPEPRDAVPEERRDNSMAVLSVDGTDFGGILELPRYNALFPVGAGWGKYFRYPCRYEGSVYDGTLKIGATTQRGQWDFYRELSLGDKVIFTDVEGNRYTYEISSLRYEKTPDSETLRQENAPLTLFLKNVCSFDYLVIACTLSR